MSGRCSLLQSKVGTTERKMKHQYSRLELVRWFPVPMVRILGEPSQGVHTWLRGFVLRKGIFTQFGEKIIDMETALPFPISHACSLSSHPWVQSIISDTRRGLRNHCLLWNQYPHFGSQCPSQLRIHIILHIEYIDFFFKEKHCQNTLKFKQRKNICRGMLTELKTEPCLSFSDK